MAEVRAPRFPVRALSVVAATTLAAFLFTLWSAWNLSGTAEPRRAALLAPAAGALAVLLLAWGLALRLGLRHTHEVQQAENRLAKQLAAFG
ncbi:MAG TPA: hypothetical protein VJU18_18330, partial [Vicinamibacteria bacterium]|nr:hypothetical protein [Vicinamibacteria bacterium]